MEAHARLWEDLVLRTLGIAEGDEPIARWANVYADISEQLATDTPSPDAYHQPTAASRSRRDEADHRVRPDARHHPTAARRSVQDEADHRARPDARHHPTAARRSPREEQAEHRPSSDARHQPSSALRSPRGEETDHDAVWALIYGARTFHVARRLLTLVPTQSEGSILDIGAGWGPFALAAALDRAAAPVTLTDISTNRLAKARDLFQTAGLPTPTTRAANELNATDRFALISLAHSLGELYPAEDNLEAATTALETYVAHLEPQGTLWILEPGTHTASRRLQRIRDLLHHRGRAKIVAPCADIEACPLLTDPRDWCHFTWPIEPGPIAERIAAKAKRRSQQLHFSWLALQAPTAPEPATPGIRVLEQRRTEKSKAITRLCTPTGAENLVALRRDTRAYETLTNLEPTTQIRLNPTALDRRGDGLRITDPTAIAVERRPA